MVVSFVTTNGLPVPLTFGVAVTAVMVKSLLRCNWVVLLAELFAVFVSFTDVDVTVGVMVTAADGDPGSSCGTTCNVTVEDPLAGIVLMLHVTVIPAVVVPVLTQDCATGNVPTGLVIIVASPGPDAAGNITFKTTFVASEGPALVTTIE